MSRPRSKSPYRSFKKRKSSSPYPKDFAKKVMRVVNKNAENKVRDLVTGIIAVDYNGAVVHVTQIPDGVLDSEREGDAIQITSLEMKGYIDSDEISGTAVAGKSDIVRMVLFRYNHDHTTTPSASEVFTQLGSIDATSGGLVSTNFRGPAINNGGRRDSPMTVLYDRSIVLGDNMTGPTKVVIDKTFKFKDSLTCTYTGATASDEGPGQIYLAMVASHVPATGNIDARFVFRTHFTDV